MIYSSWDIEQKILKLVISGHFNFEKIYTCTKNHNHMMYGSWETVSGKQNFCHFGPFFTFLPPPTSPLPKSQKSQRSKFWRRKKKKEIMPGDIILLYIHVYHKWRSYDTRFLKYKVRKTKSFVTLGHFCPFSPLHLKWQSYNVWFLRYQVRQTEFFVILDHFLPFYPH